MKESILEDYKKNTKTYHAFRERIINLLNDLLSTERLVVHQLVGRTKSLESLSKKIDDKNGKYKSIDDITDIIGIRIITYLESDIDPIAELIGKEFIKDVENSIYKRKLQADRFGYKSLHVVVSLNGSRINLKEYKRYKDFKCEIQIRSILQHAWAEIEHDLGYKGEISIPEQYKRSFIRVSALLETADIEFDRLKTELANYEINVPTLIKTEPKFVDINQASITSFLKTNPILQSAKSIIEQKIQHPLLPQEALSDTFIKSIKYCKFDTIGQLEDRLTAEKESFLKFLKFYVNDRLNSELQLLWNTPIIYFLNFLVSRTQNEDAIKNYFIEAKFDFGYLDSFLNLYKKYETSEYY